MKIVSYNVNGIRASVKLGLLEWINDYSPDILCIQEVRCNENMVKEILGKNNEQLSLFDNEISNDTILDNYHIIYNCGNIPGYAGTMTMTRYKPDKVLYDMGEYWKDDEGRTTTIIIDDIAYINAYIPNGNSRLDFKMRYLDALNQFIVSLMNTYKVICVGDFNIAHNELDISHPKECKNKSVFLPIERNAFSDLLNIGLIDCYRYLNKDTIKYSWRSYRSRQDNNYNSWKYRIDYILISNSLKDNIKNCDLLDLEYSDHLPVVLEL